MATPIVMPKLGMVMTEGMVTKWSKPAGEPVEQGEVIAEIETEKLNYDLEATEAGILHQVVSEGAIVEVAGVLGYLLSEGEEAPEAPTAPPAPVATAPRAPSRPAPPRAAGEAIPSTPGARRLAASLGVDISQATPTGPRGRVVEADVRAFAEQQGAPASAGPPPGVPTPSETVPLAGMRKTIADHMRSSIATTAQLSFFIEVDVTDAQRMRREASKDSETITIAAVLIRACAETLKRIPSHNTVLAGGNVYYFDEINIGFAVALDDGLIVPVLRSVQDKDINQIAVEIQDLASKAREGKLSPDDVVGGTFTISVLGTVDGFTPILNTGQSAILGVGRSVDKPVVRKGEIVVRETMTLSLTVDHQVIDGASAASFLRRLQQTIERPAPLFK